MSLLTRTLRLRTILPARPLTPLTPLRLASSGSASKTPPITSDQSFPNTPSSGDPLDPRHGKNLRGDMAEGPGEPAAFQNPHDVAQKEQVGHTAAEGSSAMSPGSEGMSVTGAVGRKVSGVLEGMGIGKTHAKDGGEDSVVPKVVQKAVPESVERILPNAIHNTGDSSSSAEKMAKKAGIGETHAAKGGEDSIVPKPVQKAVPKSVERALPNKIHNTKD